MPAPVQPRGAEREEEKSELSQARSRAGCTVSMTCDLRRSLPATALSTFWLMISGSLTRCVARSKRPHLSELRLPHPGNRGVRRPKPATSILPGAGHRAKGSRRDGGSQRPVVVPALSAGGAGGTTSATSSPEGGLLSRLPAGRHVKSATPVAPRP